MVETLNGSDTFKQKKAVIYQSKISNSRRLEVWSTLNELNRLKESNWRDLFIIPTFGTELNKLSQFLRRNLRIFIIKGFQTIVFIFIAISTRFRSIAPPAFFGCLSNSGTFKEIRTTSLIESTVIACSDSVWHNRVQVLSIPVLLLTCSQDLTCITFVIVYIYQLNDYRELDSYEEPFIYTNGNTITSFARELNPTGVGEHIYIYIYIYIYVYV